MDYVVIREYRKEDIKTMVDLIDKVFIETYNNIFDKEFFLNMDKTYERRLELENRDFNKLKDNTFLLEVDGVIEGFVQVGKCKIPTRSISGEIQMIYLTKKVQGKGLGKKLFVKGVERLKQLGYKDFFVGCFNGNESAKFYHHLGGEYKFSVQTRLVRDYQENFFYFEDVDKFL